MRMDGVRSTRYSTKTIWLRVGRWAGGSRGAGEEAVAERPELLANHWLQLPRWTERQAPNVNIGVVQLQSSPASGTRPELHDLPLFPPSSGILIASRSCFFPPDSPGKPSCSCRSEAADRPNCLGSNHRRAFLCQLATGPKT
jgi:hypothetical protein